MIVRRCLVLAFVMGAALPAAGQSPAPTAGVAVAHAARTSPFGNDERARRLAERYEAMLAANPVEGIALDRLWKAYEDHNATAALLDEYGARAKAGNDLPDWVIYGQLLARVGNLDAAESALATAAKLEPANPLPSLVRGDLALARHRPGDAAPFFAEALGKLPPGDRRRADLWQKLGNAWLAAGDPAKAAESWEQLLAANPSNLALHKQLADIYARNRLVDQALGHLAYLDAHAEPPARAAALREAGRLHENRGDFDAARDAYERGLALTSRDNWLHSELLAAIIRLYERAGRTAELESRWREAAAQAPRDLGGYLRLETLAETRGDSAAELEWLEKIRALAPRDRDNRVKLARLLSDRGERERAAAEYDALLKDQPGQLDLIFARADLDLQLGSPAAAVQRVEARLAQSPADETVFAPALEFFLSRHLDEAAERCLRAATERQPDAAEPAIALARFYFGHHRTEDGRHVLDQLASGTAPTAERWQRVASVYKDENLADDALRCWQAAAKLAPADPAPLENAGELLLARGDVPGATTALEKAIDLVPVGPAREEIERKLFQALSGASASANATFGPEADQARRRRRHNSPLLTGLAGAPITLSDAGGGVVAGPLGEYLDRLEDAADKQPTAGNYLRLAQWQLWAQLLNEAATSADRAIALDPANVPARLLYVRAATEARQHDLAERRLRETIALDPVRRATYLRQLAGLQMEDGDFETALAEYNELQAAQPGAVDPLMDLALAQQRADRWFDALATWKRAYALPSLTPAQRVDVRRPLIAAFEHLGEFRPAAVTLAAAIDEQPDLARKQELFQDLSAFCGSHGLGDWLDNEFEERLRAQPDDYFTMVALAARWKNKGREEEAYRLLTRAYYSAPDPVAALKSLADEAEALGDEEQAVADRRRLAAMTGQNTADNLEKLAASQEDALDEDEAAHTWDEIAARFPRNTAALADAAAFFERIGQPEHAQALLARIVAIEPDDLPHRFHFAELTRDLGDAPAAEAAFEAILAHSAAEKPGDALRLPVDLAWTPEPTPVLGGVGSFRLSRSAVAPAAAKSTDASLDDHQLRLQAIRELALLLPAPNAVRQSGGVSPGEARAAWSERWRKAAAAGLRSEPLQALYFAGDMRGTMDLLAGWSAEQPVSEPIRAAFLLAGLRLGAYDRVAAWAWPTGNSGIGAARGSQLVEALRQFLATGGKPGANMVDELFPPRVQARDLLWEAAARGYAERRWYAQAAALGERVVALSASSRPAYSVELAQWELFLNRPERARAVLAAAAAERGGISLDAAGGSSVYEALRNYVLLLPPDERSAFAARYLDDWQARGEPVHRVLAGLLLHGMLGDLPAAHREVTALLALRLEDPANGIEDVDRSADARRWSYLLNTGVQLENWNLGELAVELWRQALQERSAFERQDADVLATQAEIGSRLVVLEVALAPDPEVARERVQAYLSQRPRFDLAHAAATQLLASSQFPAARQFYEYLTREESANGENWRGLLGACESAGDLDAMETVLDSLLETPRQIPFSLNRAELVRDLAALHELEGDRPGAIRLLEREYQAGVRTAPVTSSLALCYERAGQFEDAARTWTEALVSDPANARIYRLALAQLADKRGDLSAAIDVLAAGLAGNPSPPGEQCSALVRLCLRAGRLDQARDLTVSLLQANDLEPLGPIVQAYVQTGQTAVIREILRSAVRRSHDNEVRFQLQEQLLQAELTSPDETPAAFLREMRRLRHFARLSSGFEPAYELARYTLARQHKADQWLEGELQREWKGGHGEFSAGEQLFSFYLETHQPEPLKKVVQAVDARANLPEQSLASMAQRLIDADLAPLALPISERLFRRFPQNEVYALARARALWKSGQREEADRLLAAVADSSAFAEDPSTRVGNLYEDLGEVDRARAFYRRAVQRDPAGLHSAAACLRLAHLESQRQNWPEVRKLLQSAYRHPAVADDLTPLADFLQASGETERVGAPSAVGAGFPLTFSRRAQLVAMIYERLKGSGHLTQAQAMVAARPGFLAGSAALTTAWLRDARPDQLPSFVALLEGAISLEAPPTPRLNRGLAALYMRWSDAEANAAAPNTAARLAHLVRAQELAPGDFEVARRLASLCWETHQPERAAAALEPFLAADAVPGERTRARELLAKH